MLKILEVNSIRKKLIEVEKYLERALDFDEPAIRESALSTLHAGGKRVRPALTIMTASMFRNEDNIIPLAAAMEMVHMASLIHDDIVDQADIRRGQPTINALHGDRYALHVGDYILTEAISIISRQKNSNRLLKIMGDLDTEMCLGEVEQLRSTFDVHQTIEDYYYRIDRKTALLMATSCQAAAVASDASDADVDTFYKVGYHLGMNFQIKDDILDMEGDSKKIGKPAGSDLAHGIMTLPTILVLQKDFAEKEELTRLIESRFPGGQAEVDRAISIIVQQGGLEESAAYAERYLQQAEEYIRQLPDYPLRDALLDGADYLRERTY